MRHADVPVGGYSRVGEGSDLAAAAGPRLPRGMLTDSGDFQMVSLLKLAQIREEGVEFQSPADGSRMSLGDFTYRRLNDAAHDPVCD